MKYKILAFLIFISLRAVADETRDVWQKPDKILAALKLDKENDIFCEIGAGSGYFSLKAAKYVKKVIATDINEKKLNKLNERAHSMGLKNVQTVKSTDSNSNLPNKTCDIIFMALVYHHIENRTLYLKKISRALKDGGRFVNLDNVFDVGAYKKSPKKTPSKKCRFSRKKFLSEAQGAGFSLLKSHKILNIQYLEEMIYRKNIL